MDIQLREAAFKTTVNVPESVNKWLKERGMKLTAMIRLAPDRFDTCIKLQEQVELMSIGIKRRDEALGSLAMENDRIKATIERFKK